MRGEDPFLYRLVAAVAIGASVLTSGYAAYFAFVRAPRLRMVLDDFGARIPRVTDAALSWPWIPLLVALVAGICGAFALASLRRTWYVLAYLGLFAALALCIASEIAAFWPMDRLMQSITGP